MIKNLKIPQDDNKTRCPDHLNLTFHKHFAESYHLENVFKVFVAQRNFPM